MTENEKLTVAFDIVAEMLETEGTSLEGLEIEKVEYEDTFDKYRVNIWWHTDEVEDIEHINMEDFDEEEYMQWEYEQEQLAEEWKQEQEELERYYWSTRGI